MKHPTVFDYFTNIDKKNLHFKAICLTCIANVAFWFPKFNWIDLDNHNDDDQHNNYDDYDDRNYLTQQPNYIAYATNMLYHTCWLRTLILKLHVECLTAKGL